MNASAIDEVLASFLIALPPGWARLPAREEDRDELRRTIEAIVAEALPDSLPRDTAEPWRGEFRKRLTTAVVEAGDAGASAVVMPVRPVNGVTVPASWIETEIVDDGLDDVTSIAAALLAEAGDTGSLRDVDGAAAIRTDTAETEIARDGEWPTVSTRQIVYRIAVPHLPTRWVVLSFSAVSSPGDAASAALSDALVELFDALVSTFRWAHVPGADLSDLETRLNEIRPE